jgi:large subunit ribosomal protein L3
MKRWGFGGQPARYGTSISHRSAGATGQHQDPGRVWPGTKMAGRMGGKQRTLLNLVVMRVERDLSLIFVKGNVPGTGSRSGRICEGRYQEAHQCAVFNPVISDANSYHSTAEAKRKELRGDKSVLPRGLVDLPFPLAPLKWPNICLLSSPRRPRRPRRPHH